jgi:histidine triad (HIT) family protein
MTVHSDSCPFCRRIEDGAYESTEVRDVVTFEPLNPVTPGHRLFVPTVHVHDFRRPLGPLLVSQAMLAAAAWAAEDGADANLIVSAGPAATQTVRHLHVHLVPRAADDGLELPWTAQKRALDQAEAWRGL